MLKHRRMNNPFWGDGMKWLVARPDGATRDLAAHDTCSASRPSWATVIRRNDERNTKTKARQNLTLQTQTTPQPAALRVALATAIVLSAFFGMTGASMAGSGFSEQGNALRQALDMHLISQGICKDFQTCRNALQMYREDSSDRIYLNMYGQTDMVLASKVTGFLVAHGLKLTSGMSITLHVFSGPHEKYRGLKRIFGPSQESIKLELNK